MRSRRVQAGPVGLAIAEAGAGGRPLFLVHGFTGGKEDLAEWVEPLAQRGWHAVAPDLRGHGTSDHPEGRESYGFHVFAADLLALADALGWDRFAVVGYSMGGAVAQFLALGYPQRVSAMVLVASFHGPVPGVDAELVALGSEIVRQAGMPGLAQALAARRAQNPDAVARYERAERVRPGHGSRREGGVLATSPDLWLEMAPRFVTQPDRLDLLRGLDVPAAVIVGELDGTMLDDCRRMADAIPGARLTVVRGAGHSLPAEKPAEFWAALSSFLDAV